jgi:drug/metabolite transporter (DMT)-like permease
MRGASQVSTLFLYFLFLGMLVTGTLNTISAKFQNRQKVTLDGVEYLFVHPYFQTALMFLGEFACLLVFAIIRIVQARNISMIEQKERDAIMAGKTTFPRVIMAIPAFFDCCSTTLMNFALLMLDASVWQMMRASSVLYITLFSVVFLKRKLYRHNVTGISCIVIGLVLVALSRMLGNTSGMKENKPFGFFMVIFAQLFVGGLYVVEEKFMKGYYIAPVQAVGLEGLSGFTLCIGVLLPIFSSLTCPTSMQNPESCPFGTMESASYAIEQICHSWRLVLGCIGFTCSIAFFNFFGISVTKNASALARSTIDSIRNCTVWIASILFGWEKLKLLSLLQLGGFIILTFGSLLFNEIIVLPILGFNLYTKKALAQAATNAGPVTQSLLTAQQAADSTKEPENKKAETTELK